MWMQSEFQELLRLCVESSLFKQSRRCLFHPAGLTLALTGPIYVAKVLTGGFRMSEELLDDIRVFGSHIVVLMDILGQVIECERFFPLSLIHI